MVTVLVEGLVTIASGATPVPGVGLPWATVTNEVDILLGIKVLYGNVSVMVPDPAAKAFCTSKSTW